MKSNRIGTGPTTGKVSGTRLFGSFQGHSNNTNRNPNCIKYNDEFKHLPARQYQTGGSHGCHVNPVLNAELASRRVNVGYRNVLHNLFVDENTGELIVDKDTLMNLKNDLDTKNYADYLEDLPGVVRDYLAVGFSQQNQVSNVENARDWLRTNSSYGLSHQECPMSHNPEIIPYRDCGVSYYNDNHHPYQAGVDIARKEYADHYGSLFQFLLPDRISKSYHDSTPYNITELKQYTNATLPS